MHRTVDDSPFGGGAGMVMTARAGLRLRRGRRASPAPVPARTRWPSFRPDAWPTSWPAVDGFSLLCGRYEGIDHRVREHLVDGELSVGDVVLSGGEVAACLVIEAVTRLLPGAMGNDVSPVTESFGAVGPARGAPVHPAGRVPRLGGARRPAQRRPRPDRALAPCAGPASHAALPSRPRRGCRRADRSRPATVGRVPLASPILDRSRLSAI